MENNGLDLTIDFNVNILYPQEFETNESEGSFFKASPKTPIGSVSAGPNVLNPRRIPKFESLNITTDNQASMPPKSPNVAGFQESLDTKTSPTIPNIKQTSPDMTKIKQSPKTPVVNVFEQPPSTADFNQTPSSKPPDDKTSTPLTPPPTDVKKSPKKNEYASSQEAESVSDRSDSTMLHEPEGARALSRAEQYISKDIEYAIKWVPRPICLPNYHQTCYMNAAIQCLFHIPEFMSFFLNLSENLEDKGLTAAFKIVVQALNEREIKNNDLKLYLEQFQAVFIQLTRITEGNRQEDSLEFLGGLLTRLDHENGDQVFEPDKNGINQPVYQKLFYFNGENKENEELYRSELVNFWNRFNNNFVTQLFYFIQKTRNICLNCKNGSVEFQPSKFLMMPAARKKKVYDIIKDGFDVIINDFKPTSKCSKCKGNHYYYQHYGLLFLPKILILQIPRFRINAQGTKKRNFTVNFYQNLDLNKYVEDKSNLYNYELLANVQHEGDQLNSGHYKCLVWNAKEKKWYLCDDHRIDEIEIGYKDSNVYYLMYRRVDN